MSELKYIYKKKLRLSTQKCSAAYYEAKSEEVSEGFPFPSALSERKYNSRTLLLFLSGLATKRYERERGGGGG